MMKLVICEGPDDQAVLEEIIAYMGVSGFRVEHYGGRDNLNNFLPKLTKRPEFTQERVESLGVMIDADDDGNAAWRKLADLVMASFAVRLIDRGVAAGSKPRIVGFVNGINNRGMLEDVCLQAVQEKPGYHCLEEYFRCLHETVPGRQFTAKAKFRAWMSSQADFDLRVGKAAKEGYLPWESLAFCSLRDFIQTL